ncbi:MAG: DUF445 domain-containing protein [Roseiarcus sp.]|jgi:uncharacterized membrane-anchored protein YjiN (DUF445 family)
MVKFSSGFNAAARDTDQKVRDLGRMRLIATLLLALMSVLFVATSLTSAAWPWLAYVRAFAEAAMVGACADWFAVVALFRRPFGLPIPHTGIVPHNKDRIGAALGRFMSNNFLSPSVLAKRLDKIEATEWAAAWLNDPANARRAADQASLFLPEALRALPRDQFVDWLAKAALRGVEALPAAPLASKLLAILWAQGETQALLNRAIELAEASLLSHKDFIRAKVTQNSSRFIPRWVDAMLADKVMSGLQSSLAEMRAPDHPWRIELRNAVETLIFDLANDPAMAARAEKMKAELLANPLFISQLNGLCQEIEAQLNANIAAYSAAVAEGLEFALLALGKWLQEDKEIQARLNHWGRRAALRALAPRRAEIGAYIANVVANWDATTLVNRLELQVGPDLQYIRINGTLVGGLVGLLIFVASKWLPG